MKDLIAENAAAVLLGICEDIPAESGTILK